MKMMKAKTLRKVHRYLGLILGVQFLMWTTSGMYFSWTDIDEIHGDHFKNMEHIPGSYTDLFPISDLGIAEGIQKIELREVGDTPYYWINGSQLFNAYTGGPKDGISSEEALTIAKARMAPSMKVARVTLITEVGDHHEYRKKPLPAYVVEYSNSGNVKAYVTERDGKFASVRHRSWRWFDFLWMTHTMDYGSRDDFNTIILRAFSLFGLITVLSGFVLWSVSSPTLRRIRKRSSAE